MPPPSRPVCPGLSFCPAAPCRVGSAWAPRCIPWTLERPGLCAPSAPQNSRDRRPLVLSPAPPTPQGRQVWAGGRRLCCTPQGAGLVCAGPQEPPEEPCGLSFTPLPGRPQAETPPPPQGAWALWGPPAYQKGRCTHFPGKFSFASDPHTHPRAAGASGGVLGGAGFSVCMTPPLPGPADGLEQRLST